MSATLGQVQKCQKHFGQIILFEDNSVAKEEFVQEIVQDSGSFYDETTTSSTTSHVRSDRMDGQFTGNSSSKQSFGKGPFHCKCDGQVTEKCELVSCKIFRESQPVGMSSESEKLERELDRVRQSVSTINEFKCRHLDRLQEFRLRRGITYDSITAEKVSRWDGNAVMQQTNTSGAANMDGRRFGTRRERTFSQYKDGHTRIEKHGAGQLDLDRHVEDLCSVGINGVSNENSTVQERTADLSGEVPGRRLQLLDSGSTSREGGRGGVCGGKRDSNSEIPFSVSPMVQISELWKRPGIFDSEITSSEGGRALLPERSGVEMLEPFARVGTRSPRLADGEKAIDQCSKTTSRSLECSETTTTSQSFRQSTEGPSFGFYLSDSAGYLQSEENSSSGSPLRQPDVVHGECQLVIAEKSSLESETACRSTSEGTVVDLSRISAFESPTKTPYRGPVRNETLSAISQDFIANSTFPWPSKCQTSFEQPEHQSSNSTSDTGSNEFGIIGSSKERPIDFESAGIVGSGVSICQVGLVGSELDLDPSTMAPKAIQAVDKETVHQICSSQVVVTLATAVKELLENSLDAGSRSIEVRLVNFGASSFSVSDDGSGIHPNDFDALALKHHTSKIRDFDGVAEVQTFGFRGEALSSLCALSSLSVCTRHESQTVGSMLSYNASGQLVNTKSIPRQVGTTVTILNLFSSLPVRRREFERNIKREYCKMLTVLQGYAVISTRVRLLVIQQSEGSGKRHTVLRTAGHSTLLDNVTAVFGTKQASNLRPIVQQQPSEQLLQEFNLSEKKCQGSELELEGLISSCWQGAGRSAPDRQFYFVNGRPCDPPKVSRLVNEVYRSYNKQQYPFVVLHVRTKRSSVDVNVTPDKRLLMMHHETLLLAILKSSLQRLFEDDPNTFSLNTKLLPLSNITNNKPFEFISHGASSNDVKKSPLKVKLSQLMQRTLTYSPSQNVKNKETELNCEQEPTSEKLSPFKSPSTCNNADIKSKSGQHNESKIFPKLTFKPNDSGCLNTKIPVKHSELSSNLQYFANNEQKALFANDVPHDQNCESPMNYNAENLTGKRPRAALDAELETSSLSLTTMPSAKHVCRVISLESEYKNLKGEQIFADSADNIGKEEPLRLNATEAGMKSNSVGRRRLLGSCGTNRKSSNADTATSSLLQQLIDRKICIAGNNDTMATSFDSREIVRKSLQKFVNNWKNVGDGQKKSETFCQNAASGNSVEEADVSSMDESGVMPYEVTARNESFLEYFDDEICFVKSKMNKTKVVEFSLSDITETLAKNQRADDKCVDKRIQNPFKAKILSTENKKAEEELSTVLSKDMFKKMEIVGQFNLGFIIGRLNSDLFIIDQHATDEKYNFEDLQRNCQLQHQPLLCPLQLHLTPGSEAVLLDNLMVFETNGFHFDIDSEAPCGQRVRLKGVPQSRNWTFGKDDVDELLFMLSDSSSESSVLYRPSRVRAMFASRACRKSVMVGTALTSQQMRRLVDHMGDIEQPWNCPHGRPTMRHLVNIDLIAPVIAP